MVETLETKIRELCKENAQLICYRSKGAFPVVDGMEDLLYSLCQRVVYQERQAKAELLAQCEAMVEAMEMGAFHHSLCPWLMSKECCCAKQKVDRALSQWEEFKKGRQL
jgi:hypothetical protein